MLSIKNIQPKNNEFIEYYREAIKWLNKYDKPEEIAKTKSVCYSKIGDILSSYKEYKEALANYHYALKYDEDDKGIYDKMGDILSELGTKQLAIKFYKINNLFSKILGCFKYMLKHDPENVDLYLEKGDYLLSQGVHDLGLYEKAAVAYFLATSLVPSNQKQDILLKLIKALYEIPSNEPKFEFTLLTRGENDMAEIIGDYPEIG